MQKIGLKKSKLTTSNRKYYSIFREASCIACFVFALLSVSGLEGINAQVVCNDSLVIAQFGYSHHVEPDGKPSRNDRRYIKEDLIIYEDLSFKLIYQQGRLSPEYRVKKGKWKIEMNQLVLFCEKIYYHNHENLEVEETTQEIKRFNANNYGSLFIGYRKQTWKRIKGLDADALIKKYK